MRTMIRRLRRLGEQWLPPAETAESRRLREVVLGIRLARAARLGIPVEEDGPGPGYRPGMCNRTPHPPACSRRAGGLSPVIPTRPAGVGAMVRRGPKGLSQSNVRQNATVCIRGEPLSAGSPAGRDFSAAARNSSQVLAHSRVTLLFFRPRLGEMLQDAGQPQHGGRAGGFYDQARAWRLARREFAQRSTYFEVKAGRGGKRARRRVDRYLRKLQI